MAAGDYILSIDVGSWSVKVGEFELNDDGIQMVGFGYEQYSGPVNDQNRQEMITEALQKVIEKNDFKAKKASVSVSGQLAFTRFVKLPPIDEDEGRVKQIVEFEARQNVPFDMDEVIWDYQLIGGSDELDVMFVVIKTEILDGINAAMQECGLQTTMFDIATTAGYNAVRANGIGANRCAMFLNIGARVSNLIFSDGQQFFCRNIPIAGQAITQQIAKEFGISQEEAEELKSRHAFVALGGAYEEPESEVAATISKIVRKVMTRLHGEVNRSINIYRSQQKGKKPLKLYLGGGSSIMQFTETFFQEKLRTEVEYLNPFQVIRLSGDIDRQELAEKAHLFSEVIGMALRSYSTCAVEISLQTDEIKTHQMFADKKPYFYACAAVAVLIPMMGFLGAGKMKRAYESEFKVKKPLVEARMKIDKTIKQKEKQIKVVKDEYSQLAALLEGRGQVGDVLKVLHSQLPEGVNITNLSPIEGVDEVLKKKEAEAVREKKKMETYIKPAKSEVASFIIEGYSISKKKSNTAAIESLSELFASNLRSNAKSMFWIVEYEAWDPSPTYDNLSTFKIRVGLKRPLRK